MQYDFYWNITKHFIYPFCIVFLYLSQRFNSVFAKPPAANRIRTHRLFCSTMQKCIRFSLPFSTAPFPNFHELRKRWIRSGRGKR